MLDIFLRQNLFIIVMDMSKEGMTCLCFQHNKCFTMSCAYICLLLCLTRAGAYDNQARSGSDFAGGSIWLPWTHLLICSHLFFNVFNHYYTNFLELPSIIIEAFPIIGLAMGLNVLLSMFYTIAVCYYLLIAIWLLLELRLAACLHHPYANLSMVHLLLLIHSHCFALLLFLHNCH